MKKCNKCKQTKNTEDFYTRKGKLYSVCSICTRNYNREYYKTRRRKYGKHIPVNEQKSVCRNRKFVYDF